MHQAISALEWASRFCSTDSAVFSGGRPADDAAGVAAADVGRAVQTVHIDVREEAS